MSKILVAVDGSDASCLAAQWAAKLANNCGGSVTLIYVFDMPAAEAMALSHLSGDEVKALINKKAAPEFDKALQACGENRADIQTSATIGHPADEILSYAKSGGFDHIVMGRRGLSQLGELVLGSISEKVIRRAHCPVTVLH